VSQASAVSPAVPRKHPQGLWVLFVTEMWERYSFYGMRALLVLYLIERTTSQNPGFGWSEGNANILYGWYCSLGYATPILGGLLADKLLGTHRSLVAGGIIMAIGQFCLAGAEFFRAGTPETITATSSPGPFFMFMCGLALIIFGMGFFKPCAAVMVGQLYDRTDPRRDSAYTIFYMGVNTGAAIAPLVTGWLAKAYGWHWGFASAGIGMILGLVVYQSCRPFYLKGVGLAPRHAAARGARHDPTPQEIEEAKRLEYERTRPLTRVDWDRMIAIIVLTVFAIVFWIGAQQAGASLSVFAQKKVDRSIPALESVLPAEWYEKVNPFPAPWYQSVNPVAIIVFAPIFAWLWGWLDRRGRQPSVPVKFGIGVAISGIAFVPMIFASLQAARHGLAGPQWLLLMYVIVTWGELCVSPVGLSMVNKLSPVRYQAAMMGLYYGILFFANLGAGYMAALGSKIDQWGAEGTTWWLPGQTDFFVVLTVLPIFFGLIILALAPKITRMMHGVR